MSLADRLARPEPRAPTSPRGAASRRRGLAALLAVLALASTGCVATGTGLRDDPPSPSRPPGDDPARGGEDAPGRPSDDEPAGGTGPGEGPTPETGAWPNAQDPGPDLANFPNSPFTIPKGKLYVEFAPLTLSGPTNDSGPLYNTDFLVRYGLTDKAEFRIFGEGFSAIYAGAGRTTGFSPIAFDMKVALWDLSDEQLYLPSLGVEGYVLTEFGSPAFNAGVQPSLSLLFEHALPLDVSLEWNIGVSAGQTDPGPGSYRANWNLQWALQRRFFKKFDVFTHGLIQQAGLPRVGDGIVVGAGAIWSIAPRLTLFGSYNAGVNDQAPTTFAQIGFLHAF